MSANTEHSQGGRFNGIWVKQISDWVLLPPSFFSVARTHRWMHTFFKLSSFSHFALKVFGCVTCTVVSATVWLCYCAHLYILQISSLGLLYPCCEHCSNITPKDMFLSFFPCSHCYFYHRWICGPATYSIFMPADYNNPADFTVVFILSSSTTHTEGSRRLWRYSN